VEQILLFKGADVVVGPHGAGMTNIGFCRPGTKVLELMQSTFIRIFMTRIAQAARLDYRVECFGGEDRKDPSQQSWSVDIGRMMEAVSDMIGATG
jgi:capsular polysaccharide biosynthesis protein